MNNQKTIISNWINKPVIGYVINAGFSHESQNYIKYIQKKIKNKFPEILWDIPGKNLHITLMDWIAPLVDYSQNKENLFQQIFSQYDKVFSRLLKNQDKIDVYFSEVRVTPNSIILIGEDDGSFVKIRQVFLERQSLIPNTKEPPKIIHSSISRYIKEIRLDKLDEFVKSIPVSFHELVKEFRLIKEKIHPMIEFDIVKTYKLL